MRILLVEDDESIQCAIAQTLSSQSYVLDLAKDGLEGWDLVKAFSYDLILLDVMLPKLDGISLCRRLRAESYTMPILLLTARNASADKVDGLDAGADDYVVKPVDSDELKARIRTLLRRSGGSSVPILSWGNLHLNPSNCEVDYDENHVQLTKKEFGLLELFMRNPRQIFSRSAIIENLWALDELPSEDTIKSHLKGIRQKLKAAGSVDCFETIYGQGYRLNPALQESTSENHQHQVQSQQVRSETVNAGITNLWERFKPLNLERLVVIEQAAIAISELTISASHQQQAIEAAHKLIGSLGTFGFTEGSRLARELEHLWEHPLRSLSFQPIDLLTTQLRTCMETTAKILSIDDDPTILTQLDIVLKPLGIQVIRANPPIDLTHFWGNLEAIAPDLLTLDLHMSNLDGIDLCQSIRHNSRWGWLPIVFITSQCDRETIQQIFAAGADDCLTKPITEAELVVRITNRLQRTKQLRMPISIA
jgi:DNA-binding response OmpR family regulator/HPt (histidine-containing phosphotransfer) domain-containing protein